MTLREDHALLRVFLPESDTFDGRPAWEAILARLQAAGVAGATASRGRAGFSLGGEMATDAIEVLSFDLPVVVEAVDRPERIDAVLARVQELVTSRGLVTVESVEVVRPGAARRR